MTAADGHSEGLAYIYKGGRKLAFALEAFHIDIRGLTFADLGCNVGGFTDCLLKHGAAKILAVDTGYGILAWVLRQDKRVEVFERTNALHWAPAAPVDGVVIDVGWTRQRLIVPRAWTMVRPGGVIISLFKPQYETGDRGRVQGVLDDAQAENMVRERMADLGAQGYPVREHVRSPIRGGTKEKGNYEYFLLFRV
ncbi:MAG: SAM-dependent methyltransferase [Planctomycetota bacterium]